MAYDIKKEKFEVIELMGQKALFSEERLDKNIIPEGLYSYELRESDDFEVFEFDCIAPYVDYMHAGTVIMKEPIDFKGAEILYFDDLPKEYYPGTNGKYSNMTIDEFLNKDF